MSTTERLGRVVGPIALVVALVGMALHAPDLTAMAVERVRAGDLPACWRLGSALAAFGLALAMIVGAERWSDQARGRALAAATVLLAICAAERIVRVPADMDELYHLHMAWMVSDGALPYRDFFYVHQLLWLLFGQPLFALYHDNMSVVTAGRLMMGAILATTMGVVFRLARSLKSDPWVTCLILLAFPWYVLGSLEYRPDPLGNLLCLLGLWVGLQQRPLWAGLLLGTAFICSAKASVAWLAVSLVIVPHVYDFRFLVRYCGATLAPLVGSWMWAAAHGVLGDHFRYTYQFAAAFAQDYLRLPLLRYNGILELSQQAALLPAIPALVLGGSMILAMRPGIGRRMVLAAALTSSVFFFTHSCNRQYILFALALLALVGATPSGPDSNPLRHAMIPVTALLIAGMSLLQWAALPPTGNPLTIPRLTLDNCPPGETYYGEENVGLFAHPIFRRDASYYCQPQAQMTRTFEYSKLSPPHYPPLDPPLLEYPPTVMVIPEANRRNHFRDALAARGIRYRDAGFEVLVRIPRPAPR